MIDARVAVASVASRTKGSWAGLDILSMSTVDVLSPYSRYWLKKMGPVNVYRGIVDC